MPLGIHEVVERSLFSPEAFRWRMGVRALSHDRWLQPDDARPADLAEKDRLAEVQPGETFAAVTRSEVASGEVLALVGAALAAHGLELGPTRSHPLESAGRSVQEDLCLMEPVDGDWTLTAGSVCFPTRWSLADKIGRPLREIHAPVPRYEEHIGPQVDRFFDRMAPGSLAERLNWSLVGEPARRLPPQLRQAPRVLPDDPGRDLFVRIERQTLRRLVAHAAIVFGIRIHVWPLAEVASALPAHAFAEEISTMPADIAAYKNLEGMREGVLRWLSSHGEGVC